MKHINFLAVAFMACLSLEAQNYVTLRFTAQMQGANYQSLDSVKITNVTRGWTETVYYPDTVLQMTNLLVINQIKASENAMMQNTPNPFNGSTQVGVVLRKKESIILSLYDVNGKQCAKYTGTLNQGKHNFNISVAAAQNYVFTLQSSQGKQSIKLSATQGGSGYCIQYCEYSSSSVEKHQKAISTKEFQSGDNMKFVGYSTYDNTKKINQLNLTQTGSDATYTFHFVLGYAIGDVYYNESGNAEGVVCWISDTIKIINGKYYGNNGKIVSIDEPNEGIMFATINRTTHSFDSFDGRTNTAKQMALRSDTSNYLYKERIQAAKWCTDKGEGWYLPAKCEMMHLFGNFTVINDALQQSDGTRIGTYSDIKIYWSSTEYEDGKNTYIYYYMNDVIYCTYLAFYQKLYVRAMKWINEPE